MKLADLKIGDCICTDDGFTCMREGERIVEGDDHGLFVKCDDGKHYLDGQEDDETGELVGIEWKRSSTGPA